METIKILLVKPHPSQEILEQRCPVPEKEKYFWEPVLLKIVAKKIKEAFHDSVEVEIWHLISNKDDRDFLERVAVTVPRFVIFTEIDILVTEVNTLAHKIKNISKDICTIVGGKQTSLLRKGDRYPFDHIDYAIRGDGLQSLIKLIELKQKGEEINEIENEFKEDVIKTYNTLFENLQNLGLLEKMNGTIKLSEKGVLFADEISILFISEDIKRKLKQKNYLFDPEVEMINTYNFMYDTEGMSFLQPPYPG